jgi:hypothetical protein
MEHMMRYAMKMENLPQPLRLVHHKRQRRYNRYRQHNSIALIRQHIGEIEFWQAYRMEYVDFKELVEMLTPIMKNIIGTNNERIWAPNGRVSMSERVACSLRYFAGGYVHDMLFQFGVSKAFVYASIGLVVDALKDYRDYRDGPSPCTMQNT